MKKRLIKKIINESNRYLASPYTTRHSRRIWIGQYILKGKKAVPCRDPFRWAGWLEVSSKRQIGLTRVGSYTASTIFVGLDMNIGRPFGRSKPLLFETMVWVDQSQEFPAIPSMGIEARVSDRTFTDIQERCSTLQQSRIQHLAVIEQLRQDGDEVVDLLEAE